MKQVIVITGQTATGKTAKAVSLARDLQGELINADSRQVYRRLDIVTGKDIDPGSRFILHYTQRHCSIGTYTIEGIPVWLYDIVSPKHRFSSHDFVDCVIPVIQDVLNRGKTPILIGGTYLYLKHLLYGFSVQVPPNEALRKELNNQPVDRLQRLVQQKSGAAWNKLNESDRHNPHRLIRLLEILMHEPDYIPAQEEVTRISLGDKVGIPVAVSIHGLRFQTAEMLRKKIADRIEKRLMQGALAETQALLANGFSATDPGLNSLGYKELIAYIKGECSETVMKERWMYDELHYAKRQYTFMKKDKHICWENIS
jgi:tRNA dimethylallyltransferase